MKECPFCSSGQPHSSGLFIVLEDKDGEKFSWNVPQELFDKISEKLKSTVDTNTK